MNYFVTGATGFIGRNLVERLLQREGTIYALVRAGSRGRLEELRDRLGSRRGPGRPGRRRPHPARPRRSPRRTWSRCAARSTTSSTWRRSTTSPPTPRRRRSPTSRAPGTRSSSPGRSRPAASTRSARSPPPASTGRPGARTCSRRPSGSTPTPTSAPSTSPSGSSARSARGPGASTGRGSSSATRAPGRSTRSTGPTTSSSAAAGAAGAAAWLPTVGIEGGEINIVPVDFVAAAIDHIAHQPELDGRAFHLTDPNPKTAGEVINLFAKAADAPQMTVRLDTDVTEPATGAGPRRR